MKPASRLPFRFVLLIVAGMIPAACNTFGTQSAREVSHERLLEISGRGAVDHLRYIGSDSAYHYVYDSTPGVSKTYKVRADSIKLRDTFAVGSDDSYPLYPWIIEGKSLGTKAQFE